MPALTADVQAAIVTRLACYESPTAISEAVEAEFGVKVDRTQIEKYNADRPGKKPAKKWVDLFVKTRERFEREVQAIPIAKQAVRLSRLDRGWRRLERLADAAKSPVLAMQLTEAGAALGERAAKEVGNAYTNRRELTGANGKPLVPEQSMDHLSDTELMELAGRIASMAPQVSQPVASAPA